MYSVQPSIGSVHGGTVVEMHGAGYVGGQTGCIFGSAVDVTAAEVRSSSLLLFAFQSSSCNPRRGMNSFAGAVCGHKSRRTFFKQFRIEDQVIRRHSDANQLSPVYGHIGHSLQQLEECVSVTVLKRTSCRTDMTSGFVKQN